ncbi:hypothetical protein KXV47_006238 [Aspergillus fumigatus]|nr:hypothetical protein KXX42_007861 [Aspergillus fumigatus]KAH2318963.1 hypothetical protein KXV47_006238 [Aspergillus fumigatus]KAH2659146.1 hypothetical protein KXV32_001467 [Aspergillus fumigatus]
MSKKRSTKQSRIYRRIIWTCICYVRYTLVGYLLLASRPGHKRFRLVDIPIGDTWAAREKLVNAGKIRSIGASNLFTIEKMEELLNTADIPPAVNQIEAHPYLLQPKSFGLLKENLYLTNNLQ